MATLRRSVHNKYVARDVSDTLNRDRASSQGTNAEAVRGARQQVTGEGRKANREGAGWRAKGSGRPI